jgi:hypothetical protein
MTIGDRGRDQSVGQGEGHAMLPVEYGRRL